MLETYVNGVSTRKVDRLVEQMGIAGMTKDRVSALRRALTSRSESSAHARLRSAIHIPEAVERVESLHETLRLPRG